MIAAAALTLTAWLYLVLARGGFWRFRPPQWLRPSALLPRVAVIIPARNESALIEGAVRSLAAQNYPGAFHIFVVDDSSDDGTAGAAARAAGPEVLTVLHARPLPRGWTGKVWAMSEGVRGAGPFQPDAFLFTDADIVHPPDNLARLAGQPCDLVSLMALLHCHSPAEKVLIPAFVFFFFMLYPPAWIRDPRRGTAGAAGGCMLVRRRALERAGGLEAIRGEVIDDCALARAVKRSGGTLWLGLAAEMRSVRGYGSFAQIGRMISRSAFAQLNHSALLLAGALAGMALVYMAPPVLALAAAGPAAALGAAAWLLMTLAYLPALRFYRRSGLWALALPAVAAFYAAATVHSAVSYWRGRGGLWKGRIQDA